MKLETQQGKLDLPQDFRLTMKRSNPLLSGEGDASVPTTLPSSSRNLATLGHRERIDRANRYTNKVEAFLQVGPVQKHGMLVIDTAHRREGIDTSLAIDSSDLYVKAKGKSLKKIMEENNVTETFQDVRRACDRMEKIYVIGDEYDEYDYTVVPVAVEPYEEESGGSKTRYWQYNNEIRANGHLVYSEREVHQGDMLMAVPEGYGVAPMLKLHKMLNVLFETLGYTVTSNCFEPKDPYYEGHEGLLPTLIVLHNCADCIVTGTLHYSDMMPSCTLGEFLDWLLAKFHAQPVVDSEAMTVEIVLMETMLEGAADSDWTKAAEDDWKVELQAKKRIVLQPKAIGNDDEEQETEGAKEEDDTSLETMAKPAAKTLNGLVRKYGTYVEVNETEWDALTTATPPYCDCLVLRKAEGMFYRMDRRLQRTDITYNIIYIDPRTGQRIHQQVHAKASLQVPVALGTNHTAYDRYNSDEEESFSQDDAIPLMTVDEKTKRVAPYIGNRLHYHTTYAGGEEKEEEQPIMVAWRVRTGTALSSAYFNSATTQDFVPIASAMTVDGVTYYGWAAPYPLTNEGMYATYWQRYNELLLNQAPRLTGRLKLGLSDFMRMKMNRPKLVNGQPLLPVKASASIGDKTSLTEMETIAVKQWTDSVSDEPIEPGYTGNGLAWEVENNENEVGEDVFDEITALNLAIPNTNINFDAQHFEYTGVVVKYANDSVYLGHPLREGETRTVVRKYDIFEIYCQLTSGTINGCSKFFITHSGVYYNENVGEVWVGLQLMSHDFTTILEGAQITATFTAVVNRHQTPPYDAEVEYLESTGTQYIDSGLLQINANLEYEIKLSWQGSTLSAFETFAGYIKGSNIPRNSFNKYGGKWMFGANNTNSTPVTADSAIHVFNYSGHADGTESLYMDGDMIDSGTIGNVSLFENNDKPFFLFARNNNGTPGNFAAARVYKVNIQQFSDQSHETIVSEINLIPVRVGNVGYMFDTVSRELFGNAGTGDFIVGPDIT